MNEAVGSNPFVSILWPDAAQAGAAHADTAQPDCFHDLNLDQVESAVTEAWPDENLAPFFRVPLQDTRAVDYRQAVLKDLEQGGFTRAAEAFVQNLRDMRARLASIEKRYYRYEKERVFLGAAEVYRAAVESLMCEMGRLQPASAGLQNLYAYLVDYTASTAFIQLAADADHLLRALGDIRYALLIRTGSVTVRAYAEETDAGVEVEEIFAKFRRDATHACSSASRGRIRANGLNHVEAQILDRVALLYPQAFAALDTFCDEHESFLDTVIARFAREVCFYLAWLRYIGPLRCAGLAFCFPVVSAGAKTVAADASFDIALASTLDKNRHAVVCNGFALSGPERILVVSGPNHGGKTTYARMFGQLHWLAALGLTVPGTRAQLFLFDRLFTHFEKEENIETLRGKLQDDLVRMHAILAHATPRSILIVNEIFSSTTLDDAVWLGRRIIANISQLDALAVCVTFLVELADFGAKTVSVVAATDPHDPAIRTFRVERRPADGLAYALAVARKHRVTREALLQRIAP